MVAIHRRGEGDIWQGLWEPEDLPEVFDRLLSNDQFKQVLAYLYPQVPFEMIAQKLKACKTNLDFQLTFAYDFVQGILKKAATGCEMDCWFTDSVSSFKQAAKKTKN